MKTLALAAALLTLLFATSAEAATLRLTPAKAPAGSMVTAVGTGFARSHGVVITLGGRVVARPSTSSAGSFTRRFRVPALSRGPKRVVAAAGRRVTSVFTIGRKLSSSIVANSGGQRVMVSPLAGTSGTLVRVSGAGFPRGAQVRVLFAGSLRLSFKASARGTLAARSFRVPASTLGSKNVTVRWGARGSLSIPFAVRRCPQTGVVCLPYIVDFTMNHGGKVDKNGMGTGFTYVDPPTSGTNPTGYVPANLHVTGGALDVTTTAGLAFTNSNSQDNALGVGVNATVGTQVSATIIDPPAGTGGSEQGGIWFGNDEENYAKLVLRSASSGTQVQLLTEVGGSQDGQISSGDVAVAGQTVALILRATPGTGALAASYKVGTATAVNLGSLTAPAGFFTAGSTYAGIMASHRTGPAPVVYKFGGFSVARTAAPPPPTPGAGTWTVKQSLPIALLDADGDALGGKLYLVGGKTRDAATGGAIHHKSLYIYNPATDTWTQGPDLPAAYSTDGVEDPAVVALDGKLYAFGGANAAFSGAVDSAAAYDPATNDWTMLAPMTTSSGATTVPSPRAGPVAEAVGGKIYVSGGMNATGASLSGTIEYDPVANTWMRRRDMKVRRDNAGSAVLGGKMYVFGGRTRGSSDTLASAEVYDPVANTWTLIASMPTGRRSVVVGTIGGKAQVMGGENSPTGTGVFAANQQFNPATGTWTTLKAMRTPRHGAAAGTIGGAVYVAGGGPQTGSFFTAVHEAFTLP